MNRVLFIFFSVVLLLSQARAWAQPGQQHPSGAFVTISLANGAPSICNGIPYFAFSAGYFTTSDDVIIEWYLNDVRRDSNYVASIFDNRRFIVDSLKAGDSIYCIMSFTWGYRFEKIKSNTIVMTDGSMEPPEVHIAVANTTVCQGSDVTFDAVLGPYNQSLGFVWTVDGVIVQTGSKAQLITKDLKDGSKIELRWTVNACGGGTAYDDAEPIIMRVKPQIHPSIKVTTPFSTICENTMTTFTARAEDMGNNAAYVWRINGVKAGTNSSVFSTSTLKDGDRVSCLLKTDTVTYCSIQPADTVTITTVKIPPATIAIAASANAICEGTPVTFTAQTANEGQGASYQWMVNGVKTADTTKTFTSAKLKNGDAVYSVLKTNNACSVSPEVLSNTIAIKVNPLPQVILVSKDTTVMAGSVIQLVANALANARLYRWRPETFLVSSQSLSTHTRPLPAGIINFMFEATSDAGCIQEKSLRVAVIQPLLMPNAFTPNGDGVNDVFRIPPHSDIDLEEFAVFDRWGNRVFQTKDRLKGWDGTYNKGTIAGTYVYLIKGKNSAQKEVTVKGTVTLIR